MPMVPTSRLRWATKQLDHPHSMPVLEQAWSDGAVEEWRAVGPVAPPASQADIPGVADLDARYVQQAGDTMSGGLDFGSSVAANPQDLTRHLDLHSGGFGFSITSGTLNYNVSLADHQHDFYAGPDLLLKIGKGAVTPSVPVILAADPTAAMEATTKQYVDAAVPAPLPPIDFNGAPRSPCGAYRFRFDIPLSIQVIEANGTRVLDFALSGILLEDAFLVIPDLPANLTMDPIKITADGMMNTTFRNTTASDLSVGPVPSTVVVFR